MNDMSKMKIAKLDLKIEELEKRNQIHYDKIQMKAIKKAITNNITIITQKLIKILYNVIK